METSRAPDSVTISIPDSGPSASSSPPPPPPPPPPASRNQPQQSQVHHFRFWLNQHEETSKSQPLRQYQRKPEEGEFEDEIESEDSEENERHPSAPFYQHGGGGERKITRGRIADGSGIWESEEGGRIGNGIQDLDNEGKRIRRRTDGGGSTISTLTVGDIKNEEDMEAERAREKLPLRIRFVAFARCLVAEILGTFILTMIHGGNAITQHQGFISQEGRAIANGFVITALIYAFGGISGGHFNPAITAALCLRQTVPILTALCYIPAQFVGALIAGSFLLAWFGNQCIWSTSNPSLVNWSAMLMEALMTWILILVVLCVTLRGKLIGHHAALAVGTAFVAITMFSGHYTSASFNPARTLGTALPCGNLSETWVFVAGPFLGAAIATVTIHIFRWHRTPEEKAQRKKHKLKRKGAVTV